MSFGLPKRNWGKGVPPAQADAPRHDLGTIHVPFRQWIPVTSSNLAAVWYDPESERLKIEFCSEGRRSSPRYYAYTGVPMQVFLGLLNASSKGKYHAAHIKWNYSYAELASRGV